MGGTNKVFAVLFVDDGADKLVIDVDEHLFFFDKVDGVRGVPGVPECEAVFGVPEIG